ncbi:nucleoside-diphosphate kinase [Rhizobium grahamii]|uniref:Nucleoside-diphosphate kinase n=1 Tax=Rhizobium grahamii TaxID=1120045 RepID=A0A370KEB6_9HYPH|nr:nucleoside-diphosphate kinase [Rhizobium grahamii]RDJ01985.1 nucleoside-diphosphate kinase [Rhizobium grahamii]
MTGAESGITASVGLTVYGPEVARSGLTASLDNFIRLKSGLKIDERSFSIHGRNSIEQFYSLTKSTSGTHWPIVVDLFDMRPVCVTIWKGHDALHLLQDLKGNSHPAKAAAGTVRSLFYCDNAASNLIHVSDSAEIMEAELAILRSRSSREMDTVWSSLDCGRVTHSSLRILLEILGEQLLPTLFNGDALANARFCANRARLLAARSTLLGSVEQYLAGQSEGLDELLEHAGMLSGWDRLILSAGLLAMPAWQYHLAAQPAIHQMDHYGPYRV